MKYQLFLLGAFIALVSAQYNCKASTDGLLTSALTNPKTGPLDGVTAIGPDVQFTIQTTSNFIVRMNLYGDHSIVSSDQRNFGTNGVMSGATSALDWSRAELDSGLTALSFSPPVASIVVKMNYDPAWLNISSPTIIVYSENNTRVACYDIEALAPIRTSGSNGFAYRGVTLNSNTIGSVQLSGASMAYWDITFDTVSPPVRQVSGDSPLSGPGSNPGTSDASKGLIASISLPLLFSFLYLF